MDSSSIDGSQAGNLISLEMYNVLSACELYDKVLAAVTDNGTNVAMGMNDMGLHCITCYAHRVNLAVVQAIEAVPELDEVKQKVSTVVREQQSMPRSKSKSGF